MILNNPSNNHNILNNFSIFVVGNSRSGTTMMGRILGNHKNIFTFHELHFFEQLWSINDKNHTLSPYAAKKLAARLLCIQRDDYFKRIKLNNFIHEANDIIHEIKGDVFTSTKVFEAFLYYETIKNNKNIPCDQTPRNVFYMGEILELYPNSKIINMIRDPRDVLLSQKRKWKRRFLGAKNIPLKESFRSWINYNPVTISKLWNASIYAADKYSGNNRIISLRFEDLLKDPENYVRKICDFLEIPFYHTMLEIPQIGSSSGFDQPEKKGINSERINIWKKGGLNSTEVYICQKITCSLMNHYGYPIINANPNYFSIAFYIFILPIKLLIAFVLNIKRMKNIKETIRKRL
ncbi:MAG TPA: sulfotransferase family protein [Candidatus Brocadiaceae bacterium]